MPQAAPAPPSLRRHKPGNCLPESVFPEQTEAWKAFWGLKTSSFCMLSLGRVSRKDRSGNLQLGGIDVILMNMIACPALYTSTQLSVLVPCGYYIFAKSGLPE